MASGAVIANAIFFEILPAHADGVLRLRATPQHEVWLESTQALLEACEGVLRIVDGADRGAGRLIRTKAGYALELHATAAALNLSAQRTLIAHFDVEYQQSYESPGGYSDAYGIRYWDDVAYPSVALSRFEIR